jgi:hypothetical protein
MRCITLIAALGAVALMSACSRSDDHSASTATASVTQNRDVKTVEVDVRKAGHDAAKDLRKLAAEAKVETHKLAADTRNAGHDVTHNDHDHDRSDSDRNS